VLTATELGLLSVTEKRALVAWTLQASGGKVLDGEVFVPQAVRSLPLQERLALALDERATSVWMERERRRVAASPVYFVTGYGHLQPPTGPPIPFELWPLVERAAELAIGARSQAEVLDVLWRERRVLMLKARQLGMTWLVLHYAYWVMAFRRDTPRARILALSKHGGDASKLLERARRIRELLPPYLRHDEDPETRGSKSELGLVGRGRMVSLAGSPEAARMETATLALVDEMAFIRNQGAGPTITALESTIGETGQAVFLSTGNGEVGDGGAFADEVKKALDGNSNRYLIFLPRQTDPKRDDAWAAHERRNYQSDEDFGQEHPETVEQALAGERSIKVYPTAHVAAAAAIGKAIGELDIGQWVDALVQAEGLEWGVDWGDFQTHCTWGVGLPAGGARAMPGLLLVDELVQALVDPEDASLAIFGHQHRYLAHEPRFVASRADSNPPGNNRILAKRLARRRDLDPGRWPEKHISVPFGVYKEGGSGKKGVNTVGYLQALMKSSWELVQQPGWDEPERLREVRGVLAISPRCKLLLAQLRNLEKDPSTAKVRKPDADPKHPERGDHGPDSVVALAYRRAEKWTATAEEARDQ
jgi:hypothetical protein